MMKSKMESDQLVSQSENYLLSQFINKKHLPKLIVGQVWNDESDMLYQNKF